MPKKREKQSAVKKNKVNLFKVAWISAILIVLFSIISNIIVRVATNIIGSNILIPLFIGIINLILSILFILGFYALGKKYDVSFLKVMAIILIIGAVISFLVNIFVLLPVIFNISSAAQTAASSLNIDLTAANETQQQIIGQTIIQDPNFLVALGYLFLILIIYVIFAAILSILLGVGLIKVSKKVKYAKTAGILEIVGGATAIILIGFLVMLVAFVYELVIFYRESKN